MSDQTTTTVQALTPELQAQFAQQEFQLEQLQEAIGLLELQLEDQSWTRLGFESGQEFSREGLRKIIDLSRIFFLKNPLIRRAVELQTFYVWAQGAEIHHRVQEFSEVLAAFLDDSGNWAQLGHAGRMGKEQTCQNEGNLFFVFFPNRSNGFVRLRTIPVDEMQDILTNPEDRSEPWFYKRVWMEKTLEDQRGVERTAYHPDWRYKPLVGARRLSIAGKPIEWGAPVYHVKTGSLDHMRFGLPETYPSQAWAKTYTDFLDDFATLARAYSRFAHKLTTPGGSRAVAAAKTKIGTTLADGNGYSTERNPPPVAGSTFIQNPGTDLQPMRIGGANVSAEDGRRLLLMVAAGSGWPEVFFGDANVGNHATAKALDRPSELRIRARQQMWSDILRDIIGYVFEWAARAPSGPLRSFATTGTDIFGRPVLKWKDDPKTGQPYVPYPEVEFPPVVQHDVPSMINAVVSAATLSGAQPAGTLPKRTTVRMLLSLLGEDDIDETLQRLFPPETEGEPDPWMAAADATRQAQVAAVQATAQSAQTAQIATQAPAEAQVS